MRATRDRALDASRRARVLIVGRGEPERGGIPSFLAMLVDNQEKLGYDVMLVNLARESHAGGRATWSNLSRTLVDAGRVLRVAQPGDIVHVHSALAPMVTCLRAGILVRAARARGAHTVIHAHGGRLVSSASTAGRRRVIKASLGAADVVLAVSARVRDTLLAAGLNPTAVRHLPNGVVTSRFDVAPQRPQDPPRVLFAGGITPRKGVLELIAASNAVLGRGVPHQVWLVGGVPDEGESSYREVADRLPAHVLLMGEVPPDQMPTVYACADIFCLPSWWEAMPLTVLEAQASGLPVIATDVGDVASMVTDGVSGHIVPPRDADALAEALHDLLTDAPRRMTMGDSGRKRVEQEFGHERLLSELRVVFDEVRALGVTS